MLPAWIAGAVSGLIKPATVIVQGWQARKSAKLSNEITLAQAATQAKIKRLETAQDADIAWEITSLNNSGWKDEFFVILLSIPMILCFIPGMDVYVLAGFASLDECPSWYRWAFMVAVGSSFGYKKLADYMSLKKGS